jgi:hypothetical protein
MSIEVTGPDGAIRAELSQEPACERRFGTLAGQRPLLTGN